MEEGKGKGVCAEARPTGRRTTKVGGLGYEPPSPPGVRTPPLITALPSAKGLVAGPSRSRHQG